jgi:glyceraldehyde 3-phosphate dehydrogenase
MAVKVGINGFGRIGKLVFQIFHERPDFEVVAINDLASPHALAHLLKYDSVHGRWGHDVTATADSFEIGGKTVWCFQEKDPKKLPWKRLGVDLVIEATGVFRTRTACMQHIEAGAKKVILTVPADKEDDVHATIVMGVNEESLRADDHTLSNASCTTNCLAPLAKVLHEEFGIEKGLMTTVHAYTNDQRTADQIHKDLRRARAAALNIIPTTTGAAKAVGQVLPVLKGKLHGYSLRVPVPDGSVVDLTFNSEKPVSVAAINAAVKKAAEGPLKGILKYTEDEIVSSDIIHDPHSSVFDARTTMVLGDKMAKVVSWYDNEWGYSQRVVDLAAYAAKRGFLS